MLREISPELGQVEGGGKVNEPGRQRRVERGRGRSPERRGGCKGGICASQLRDRAAGQPESCAVQTQNCFCEIESEVTS